MKIWNSIRGGFKRMLLRTLKRLYEPFMAVTAVVLAGSVAISYAFSLSPAAAARLSQLDTFAYIVFALDFFIRLYVAPSRRKMLARHWVDLVALLPIGMVGHSLRWYRAIRGFVMLRRYSEFFHGVFLRHGFLYILVITVGLVVAGAYAIQRVEPGLGNFGDALWWSFVTTTTVGYGDISPKTAAGRAVAVVLMLFGIGFVGLFTGTVATFFVERNTRRVEQGILDEQLDLIRTRLDRLDELSRQEFSELVASLNAIYDARERLRQQSAAQSGE